MNASLNDNGNIGILYPNRFVSDYGRDVYFYLHGLLFQSTSTSCQWGTSVHPLNFISPFVIF